MKGLLQYTKECKTVPSLINAPFLSKEVGIETTIDDKASGVGVVAGGGGGVGGVGDVLVVVVMFFVVLLLA